MKEERCYLDEQGFMVVEEVWVEKTDTSRPFADLWRTALSIPAFAQMLLPLPLFPR